MFQQGVQIGNLWIKEGNKILIRYFNHEFKGTIIGFGTKGCTVKPDVEEPWMMEYLENQFDGIKPGHLQVYYDCILEVISHK